MAIEWVAQMAAGDSSALARLYDATHALVYRLARRLVRDAQIAEEVTLDSFHQAWRQATAFRPERGSVEIWLLAITRSRAIDRLRSEGRRRREVELARDLEREEVDRGPRPEQLRMESEAGEIVQRALGSLPAEQRDALQLVYGHGLSHRQAADELGQPVGTIKTRVRLGLRRLRDTLVPGDEW